MRSKGELVFNRFESALGRGVGAGDERAQWMAVQLTTRLN